MYAGLKYDGVLYIRSLCSGGAIPKTPVRQQQEGNFGTSVY